jgi:hypothetical protein
MDTTKTDVVVMTARMYQGPAFSGYRMYEAKDVFDEYEQELFTSVVATAEKAGKPVHLLVVPAKNVFDAIVVTAQHLGSGRIVCGLSNKLNADEQAKLTGDAWERLPEPRPRITLDVISPDGSSKSYQLGPHVPRLRPQDVDLLHKLWLDFSSDPRFGGSLHHYHVLAVALEELKKQMRSGHRDEILQDLQEEMSPEDNVSDDRQQPN